MPKKTIDDFDDLLSYYHSYLGSALTLLQQSKTLPKLITGDDGYILAAHFLMGHGIELNLKLCIGLFGEKMPTGRESHNFQFLLKKLEPLYKKYYKSSIFNKEQKQLIDYFNRTMEFRYPTGKNWVKIPDIFIEPKKWSAKKAEKNFNKWDRLRDRLNDLAYRIAKKGGYN